MPTLNLDPRAAQLDPRAAQFEKPLLSAGFTHSKWHVFTHSKWHVTDMPDVFRYWYGKSPLTVIVLTEYHFQLRDDDIVDCEWFPQDTNTSFKSPLLALQYMQERLQKSAKETQSKLKCCTTKITQLTKHCALQEPKEPVVAYQASALWCPSCHDALQKKHSFASQAKTQKELQQGATCEVCGVSFTSKGL